MTPCSKKFSAVRLALVRALVVMLIAAPSFAAEKPKDKNKPKPNPVPAASAVPQPSTGLDNRVQDLKKEVLDLNRDLFALEEELLFPASTQLVVFLSMDLGSLFALDSVEVKLNNRTVANYLYTDRELDALRRGGVQQLFIGNIPTGETELVAFFVGKGPHGRDYRRGTTYVVKKDLSPKYIELKISDDASKQQSEFIVREW